VDRGILPEAVRYRPQVWVLAMVVGIAAGTSLVGGLVAAVRPSRVRPAVALSETGVRRRVGPVRVVLGGVLVAGGAALSVPVARLQADRAASTSVLVMLALCLGIGLIGPVILRAVSRLARAPMGALGGSGVIAVDNLGAASKALSGALVPLVLAVAFATVQVALHTTPPHVTGVPEPAAGPWLDYSGTAVYCAFAAVAALNTLITVGIGRRRELAVTRLAGATRGRVLGIVVCEAVLVTATALVLAAGVAGTVLAPMLHTAQHTWLPYLPPWYLAGAVGGALALVAAGTLGPAAVLTARSAIEAVDPAG
jgi:putative ABC transport system permease protein